MEIATVTSKGQITIPAKIRKQLHLNAGDKLVIQEENGRFYIDNAAMVAFYRIQNAFEGAAEENGYQAAEDMDEYLREVRKDVRGY